MDVLARHEPTVQRVVQLTNRGALLEVVDDHGRAREDTRVDLLFVLRVCAHRGHERPGTHMLGPEPGRPRGGTRHADVRRPRRGHGIRGDDDVQRELGPQVPRELRGSARVGIVDVGPAQPECTGQGPQVHPPLGAATEDGEDARIRPGEVAGRDRRGGRRPQPGDLHASP